MQILNYNNEVIDKELEYNMNLVKDIVSVVHSIRKNNKIKVRQPLSKFSIFSTTDIDNILNFKDIILSETNVKNIEILNDSTTLFKYKIKPNFKILGKKYGNKMKDIADKINNFTDENIDYLLKNKEIKLDNGIILKEDEYILETISKENICVEKFDNIIIALDTVLDDDLKQEGIARDFINIIQNYRKNNDFNIDDITNIDFYCSDKYIVDSILKNNELICKTILCDKLINVDDNINFTFESDINDINIKINIMKI